MRKRKIVATFLAVVISAVLLATPVLAAYSGLIQIITGATAYTDPLPAITDMDNALMVAESIIDTDGLDVRVERSGAGLPRMLADDKTLFASALNANSTTNFYYTTDNAPPEVFDVLTGYDGNITIYDAGDGVTLELGSDFEIEQKGYVDTEATTVSFQAAGVVSEAANGNVTPALPVGWAANDIWLCLIASLDNVNSTLPGGWTAIDAGTNNGANLRTTLYWRRAITGDAAPLVTHAAGAGISAVIIGYSGVTPEGSPFDINQVAYIKTPASIVNNFGAGMTTTFNNDTIVLLSGVGGQTTSITYTGTPTPTERVDEPDTVARPSLVIADFTLVTAGATGARASTITSFLNNGYQLSLIPIQKNLVYKEDAYRTYISADNSITSNIWKGNVFPTVMATNGGNDVVDQLNHTVNLPAGIVGGDLLLAFFSSDQDVAVVIIFPGGWTQLFQGGAAPGVRVGAWYRVADGTEGASIVATTNNNQMTAHTTYRITSYSGVPESGAANVGNSANPDPPNLIPSWGAKDTLWFAVEGNNWTENVINYPANYADGLNDIAVHAQGCAVGSARRELNAVAEDPGLFTISGGQTWVAGTVAIAPADLEATATGISSGEYTVKTYGVANEPAWATGDVLHFTGAADSNVNYGVIHNAAAKLWVSFWLRLDSDLNAGDANQYVWTKFIDGANLLSIRFNGGNGKLVFLHTQGGGGLFSLNAQNGGADITSWNANQWYHVIASISSVNSARFIVDNGTVVTDVDNTAAPNGGIFIIGDIDDPGAGNGFIGEIQNVIVGTDDLTPDEEDALYAGTAPGDETNYWYIDEGTGLVAYDYGTGGNDGTIDNAPTWETATYTTGKTGRLCDFYIEVDDGVADPDRWGKNLKGATVTPNGNDWRLNQNNVMPWMDYYHHTVGGVLHAWYQPNYIVEATNYDGTETAGGSAITVTDNTMTEAPGYWEGALVTITEAGGAAPEGEARVCTVFAAGGVITVAPAFSANVDIGDDFTIDFGALIDRSYYGLEFDGISGDVTVADAVSIQNIFDGGGTVECWIYPRSDGEGDLGRIWDKRTPGGGWRILTVGEAAGKVQLQIRQEFSIVDGDWVTTPTKVTLNTWSYIVLTYDNSAIGNIPILYVNGSPVVLSESSTPNGIRGTDVGTDLTIGNVVGDTATFDGIVDGANLYTRILGPDEVTYNYNGGAGRYIPYSTEGLVAQWHIEDGGGATVTDTSGEGNDGVVTTAAWINGFVPRPAGNSGTNDSRITWGVNPADISYTIGSLVSTDVTIVTVTAPTPQDVLPVLPDIELFGMAAPDNMFSPWFDTLSNFMDIPSVVMWVTFAMLLIVGIAVLIFFVTKSVFASTMIAAFLMAGCSVSGFLPVWTLILALIIAVFSLAQKKVI